MLPAVCPIFLDILRNSCYHRDVFTAMDLRSQVRLDWLDYQQLMSLLRGYAKPRDRVSALLADGSLVRIKKGLYVFGERYRREPISREVLANLIYGPSYVSLDYALSRYSMIPERVEDVTSVTIGEKRRFSTPLGVFTYQPLSNRRYSLGIQWIGEGDIRFLMASREKALIDKVWTDKRFEPTRLSDFEPYLTNDLRLDEKSLQALDQEFMATAADAFASRKLQMLVRYLARFS